MCDIRYVNTVYSTVRW